MNVATPNIEIGKRIAQYVKLRDRIKEIKDRHKDELAVYIDMMDRLEMMLLDALNNLGLDSIKSPAGTAYRRTKHSATIADADAFRRHVIGTQAWELADWKANAPAVEAFIEENQAPPPGVNFSSIVEVGVRRT